MRKLFFYSIPFCFFLVFISVLSFSSPGATGSEKEEERSLSPIRIELIQRGEINFATFLNDRHPENRVGYRFFEHKPLRYGKIPLSDKEAGIEAEKTAQQISEWKKDSSVVIHTEKIGKNEYWSRQHWTYYLKPVDDGIELLMVVKTFAEGLPEYYGVQQCFRLGGSNNIEWRKKIANTPAFSEYQLWERLPEGSQRKSLTWVIRDQQWQSLPAGEDPIGARTPLGIAVDLMRTSDQPMEKVGPYEARMLPPIDNGLITRVDANDQWVCGIYWENTSHVTNHHPADCLHPIVNIGNIPPYSKRAVRGKIYWFEGSKKELQDRLNNDFLKKKRDRQLVIASCQFPVSGDIGQNFHWIKKQMKMAKIKGADLVHFPETALSGYGGADVRDFSSFDWESLKEKTASILQLAAALKLWAIPGSTHPLSSGNKPHNSLYVIHPEGKIIDRYDKRFCTGGDLKYYSPGDHFVTFDVNGVKCGLLICYDVRFPELYREYRKLGVDVIFQSFYNARQKPHGIHPRIMPVTAQARAATNYFYMSLTNSSAPYSWPCHFITPDGLIESKLEANQPGILISTIDLSERFYDASRLHRMDAIGGKLNSGESVADPRSADREVY